MSRRALLAWALFAAAFCWRLDPVHRPLVADNQLYFYMAERAASGVPPHVSHVDSKNQLGVLITAAAIAAGRPAGVDDVLASRIVSIAFLSLSVALAAELAAALAGSTIAGHVSALSLLAVRALADHSAAGNNVKVFLVAFVLLAHLAAVRAGRQPASKAWLAAGVASGAAFVCWQPALLVVAAVAAEALLARGGSLRGALIVLAGALVPVALYEVYFAVHGALAAQLHQAYVMTSGSMHPLRSMRASLAFVLTEAGGMASPFRAVPLAFASALVLALAWAAPSPARAVAALRERAGLLSFVVAALGAVAFTLYDHQGVPDLFFPDPYFAVVAGWLVAGATAAAKRLAPRPVVAAFPAAALALLAWQMHGDDLRRKRESYDLDDQRRVAGIVKMYREQLSDVWVYGAVHLLGLAHLDNHVPYGLFYDDVLTVLSINTYLPLREGRMPEIIVHSRGQLPGSPRYLEADYVEITPPAFAAQSAMVWRRRTAQPPGIEAGDWRDFAAAPHAAPPAPIPPKFPRWERPSRPLPLPAPGGIAGPRGDSR